MVSKKEKGYTTHLVSSSGWLELALNFIEDQQQKRFRSLDEKEQILCVAGIDTQACLQSAVEPVIHEG